MENTLSKAAEEGCTNSDFLAAPLQFRSAVSLLFHHWQMSANVVKIVYPKIMDVRCFSHTLDLVGDKFKTPLLASFCSYWISLFTHSPKFKMLWKNKPVSLCPLIAKHDGGASGKYSTK